MEPKEALEQAVVDTQKLSFAMWRDRKQRDLIVNSVISRFYQIKFYYSYAVHFRCRRYLILYFSHPSARSRDHGNARQLVGAAFASGQRQERGRGRGSRLRVRRVGMEALARRDRPCSMTPASASS